MLPSDAHPEQLSPLDRALVHALQINARAPWTRIAEVIGVDASTAARRWAALAEQRWAWFALWPSPQHHAGRTDVALVLLPGLVDDATADRWARQPAVATVERTTAGLLVVMLGQGGLDALEERVRTLALETGVRAEIEFAVRLPVTDSQWHLQALSARDQHLARAVTAPAPRGVRPEVVAELTALLRDDVRMTHQKLGAGLGVSEATARRLVEHTVGAGLVRVGIDVAMPAVGLGRGVMLRARPRPGATVEDFVADPAAYRVMHVVGPAPLIVSCRMGSLQELARIEAGWPEHLEIVDRRTVTRVLKRNGHLLGPDGRSVEQVPLEW